jgi:predicted SAM-dependent methyltransferase
MDLRDRGMTILREDGFRSFVGRGLRFTGNRIIEGRKRDLKADIVDSYSEGTKFLNIGGGTFLKQDWRVLDYYTDWYDYDPIFIDYNVDLESRSTWPIDTGEYELVYTSHTLEHLTDEAVKHTVSEAHRILKKGGTLRINVPDANVPIEHYEEGNIEWFEDVRFDRYSEDVYNPRDKCSGYELEFYLLSAVASYLARIRYEETNFSAVRDDFESMDKENFLQKYTNQIQNEWHNEYPGWHRNWFTPTRLVALLRSAGFQDVEESRCRQSSEPEMCTEHFDMRPHMSAFAEGTKQCVSVPDRTNS